MVPGKDAHTVERFVQDFIDRNGDPNRVGLVTCNISLEFARGICEHLPNAAKVIDKFHTSSSTPTRPSTGSQGRGRAQHEIPVSAQQTNPPEPQLEIKRSLRRRRPRTARACRMCEPCRTSAPTAPTGSGPKRGQSIALADDALPSGSHEGLGPTATPSLGRRSRLLRSSVRQRNPRGPEQHHPERKNPRKGLQEHELLQRDDLPAAIRSTNRHYLTDFTHTKQRKATGRQNQISR